MEIIPNWHPIFVHFTIALLTTSCIFYTASYLFNHVDFISKNSISEFEIVGRWSLWLGALITTFTVLAGLNAFNTVSHDEISHTVMTRHRNLAFITASAIWICSIWSLWRYFKNKLVHFPFIIFLLIIEGLLFWTAWYGGELVYRHGLGVISLPQADEKTTLNEKNSHAHEHTH